MRRLPAAALLFLALAGGLLLAAGDTKEEGFVPMFNGKDLSGWVNVNCAPNTFFVKDDLIVTTGKPTGFLRTPRQYENFIAEFDWMHVPPRPDAVGNSGFFVWADPIPAVGTGYTRGIEVQVLVNLTYTDKKSGAITASSHGDLFSIWGATCVPDRPHPTGAARCLPSENRAHGANEWNHYRVEANDGVLKLAVNGKVVSGVSKCSPRKGYLALESEGSECRFRNLRIKELPSTNPRPEDVADLDRGFRSLYTGLDLSGWEIEEAERKSWQPRDTVLHHAGRPASGEAGRGLRTQKRFGDAEFIFDFRFPKKDSPPCEILLREGAPREGGVSLRLGPDGSSVLTANGVETRGSGGHLQPAGKWNRLHATLREGSVIVAVNGKQVHAAKAAVKAVGPFALHPGGEMDFANLFVREGKE